MIFQIRTVLLIYLVTDGDMNKHSIGVIHFSILFPSVVLGYFLWSVIFSLNNAIDVENRILAINANIEPNGMNPIQSVSGERIPYLRTPSLPTYDNVMLHESSKETETPPPNYNQISFLVLAVRQLHANLPFGSKGN